MKILIYRYGSICEPDVIAGFEEIGFEVTQLTREMEDKHFVFGDSVDYVSEFLLENPYKTNGIVSSCFKENSIGR